MSYITLRGRLGVIGLAVGAIGAAATVAAAQDANKQSAYVALIYTPVAGLPPLAPNADSLGTKSGITLQGRLGHMSRQGGLSLTSYGMGVELPKGRTRFGATLAYMSASCGFDWQGDNDCAGDIMLGANVRSWLLTRPLGESPPPVKGKRQVKPNNQGSFVLGFDGSVGYSPRQGESAMSAAALLPAGLQFQSGTVKVMPFISPGLAYGRLGNVQFEDEDGPTSHSAIVPMVGGGLGLEFGTSGMGANVGFQRVLKGSGGTTQLGLGFTWNGMTAR